MDPTAALAQGEQLLEQAAASHDPQALAAAIERLADAGEHILPRPDPASLDRLIGGLSRAMSTAVDQENARALVVAAHNLCAGLLRRYEVRRDPSDLDRATDGFRALLHVMTSPAPQRAAVQDNLAAVLRERFALRHDVSDLRAAVNLLREAIQQTPPASGLYVYRCGLLAMSALNLYQATGDLADLDQESSALRNALAAPPTTAPMREEMLGLLLATYMARYARTQDAADLDRVIGTAEEAVAATPLGHPDRADRLRRLGSALGERSSQRGSEDDLNQAIRVLEQAVDASADDLVDRARALLSLGNALRDRSDSSGDDDLDRAIDTLEAAAAIPAARPQVLPRLNNLGLALRQRYSKHGGRADLDRAITILQQAVEASEEDSPDRERLEFNASLAYSERHRLTKSVHDLDRWLTHAREAVRRNTEGDPGRAAKIENLVGAQQESVRSARLSDQIRAPILDEIIEATTSQAEISAATNRTAALISRYEHRGRSEDLDQAITILRRLVDQPSQTDAERAGRFSNLGIALMMRYDLSEVVLDLREGLAATRQAVDLAPEDDPERPMYISNLSLLALTYAQRHGWAAVDLDLAVDTARAALAVTPPDDVRYADYLSNLATALLARCHRTPDLADLDEAVSLTETAAGLSRDSLTRGRIEGNVATAKLHRYMMTGSPSDLDDVITRSHRALQAVGDDEQVRGALLVSLAQALNARHQPDDLAAGAEAAQEAAGMVGAALTTRLQAARGWADAAREMGDWTLACRAFADIGDLLNIVASTHLSRPDQEFAASRAEGLPSLAAAAHLEAGDPEGAAEAFERTHAVLLAHQLGTQWELRALAKVQPDLADDYRKIRGRLAFLEDSAGPPEDLARERAQLLQSLDATLARIRALDGFGAFASGPSAQDLHQAAVECPVVLFSICDQRSDALIIKPSAVEVVSLPQVTPQLVQEKALLLLGAVDDAQQNFTGLGSPLYAEYAVHQVLGWLWDCVTEPVLNALGLDGPPRPDAGWPAVCWCPSGFLTMLPLHAAGRHQSRSDAVPQTVMDRVVSTYTPTVRNLRAPVIGAQPKPRDLVVVAMPSTPGYKDLPGAAVEARTLGALFGDRARLLGEVNGGSPATVEAVLQALPSGRRAHFACHALSDLAHPSLSRLLLAEGNDHPLTFRELMTLDLDGAELAYLSACGTARSAPALLEEVVHLASTFTLVGYAHVIATLWSVGDQSAAFVADRFYRGLRQRDDAADVAAIALHDAVRELRDSVPDRPSKWAAYVHVGKAAGTTQPLRTFT